MLGTTLKYFWEKLLLTIPVGMFALTQQHYLIIWGLALVVIIDTILGLWVSIKYKVFAERDLIQIYIHRLSTVSAYVSDFRIYVQSFDGSAVTYDA